MKMVMNGVPVARRGLILGEDEATPSRKVFKYLPGPPGPVFGPKMDPKIPNPESQINPIKILSLSPLFLELFPRGTLLLQLQRSLLL